MGTTSPYLFQLSFFLKMFKYERSRKREILYVLTHFDDDEIDFLKSLCKSIKKKAKKVAKKAKSVAKNANKVVKKAAKGIKKAAKAVAKFAVDKLKILQIAKAIKTLVSKGLDFVGLNIGKDVKDLVAIFKEHQQQKLEQKLAAFMAKMLGSKVVEKIPTVGQLMMILKTKKELAQKVNLVFKKICGAVGKKISIEGQFQKLASKIFTKKTLKIIPFHDKYIKLIKRTLAEEIIHLRSKIITELLARYGLSDKAIVPGFMKGRTGKVLEAVNAVAVLNGNGDPNANPKSLAGKMALHLAKKHGKSSGKETEQAPSKDNDQMIKKLAEKMAQKMAEEMAKMAVEMAVPLAKELAKKMVKNQKRA